MCLSDPGVDRAGPVARRWCATARRRRRSADRARFEEGVVWRSRHARTCRPRRCDRSSRRPRDSRCSRIRRARPALQPRARCGDPSCSLRQGDAGDVARRNLREIKRQAAPAAADVEHAVAGIDEQFGRDMPASWRPGRRPGRRPASRNRRRNIAGRRRGRGRRARCRCHSDARRSRAERGMVFCIQRWTASRDFCRYSIQRGPPPRAMLRMTMASTS